VVRFNPPQEIPGLESLGPQYKLTVGAVAGRVGGKDLRFPEVKMLSMLLLEIAGRRFVVGTPISSYDVEYATP